MYDRAVYQAVKKLRKKPSSKNNILVLEKAYPLANERNTDRIKYLKQDGSPDVWDEVFEHYNRLKERQNLVKTVTPLNLEGRTINFKVVDYDQEIIAAKEKAAEYFYVHAQKLLKNDDKESARQAYSELMNVKSYYNDYKDLDSYIKEAKYKGTSRVFVSIKNKTGIKLPPEFTNNLLSFGVTEFNSAWVEYYLEQKETREKYDYNIAVNLKIIDVSPERIKDEETIESKEVEDGWEYVLDENGNVMQDSVGNDIKIPKYKTITCKLIKSILTKAAHIEGNVEYIDLISGQSLKTLPIAADHLFRHVSAQAHGDLDALSEESKKLLDLKPVPFPPNPIMINNAGETLKNIIHNVLRDNRRYLR